MKFTSIKQIPKEAIEMIDEVQWWRPDYPNFGMEKLPERLDSETLLGICNKILPDGNTGSYLYIEPRELEDKTYGINLYKKIHGEG